jgi:hypothetical protein
MSLAWIVNPSRRRRAKGGKHRSAAQKAATRRMLAANRGRRSVHANPGKRHRRRAAHRNPIVRHVYRNPTAHRKSRRSVRRTRHSFSHGGGIMGMLKAGAIAGSGALLNDVLMGFAAKVLPPTMTTPQNADGTTNFTYFAAKGALALTLGTFGKRVLPGAMAGTMAQGALTVLAYQLMRGMVPASLGLGYYNPAPTTGRMAGAGAYVGAYSNVRGLPTPMRALAGVGAAFTSARQARA